MKKYLLPVLSLSLLIPATLATYTISVKAANVQQTGDVQSGNQQSGNQHSGNAKHATVKSVTFNGSTAPQTPEERAKEFTNASVEVTYTDGTKKTFPLSYKQLFKTTDSIGGVQPGVAVDVNGKAIMDNSVAAKPVPFVSEGPDGTTLFKVPATSNGNNGLYMINHYEYINMDNAGNSAYGLIPASMSLDTIDQDKKDGSLKVSKVKKIDFSGVDGLWIPCNASLSPWNTHLGSEEYEPDARSFQADPSKNTYVDAFNKSYYQDSKKTGNPYLYGYITEVAVTPKGETNVSKHYSMGRFSHELSKVMPDNRTAYFGDDGGNTMLFMYVADKEKDLSSGTLYAAKWIQKSDKNGGSADLQWIKLGHATDKEIKEYAGKLKFSDIFETATQDTPGFKRVRTYSSNGKDEWLKVKPGMEKAAAFLESRRYGALLGATSEFNKMEGVTFNQKDNRVYVAMSYVEKSMLADATAPADDIRLPKLSAGTVYELTFGTAPKDSIGQQINSSYVAGSMNGLISGEDLAAPDAVGNTAVVDKIANPDNISFSEKMRTLFIGEDSGMHTNNFVWAYNIDTKQLSRVLSVPAGAEATGLGVIDDLNGFSYITSNVQHPGDLSESKTLPAELKAQLTPLIDKKSGVVGYISGMPSLTEKK